jgi:GDP-4-dehydro-6-deoxy-D-mannose reductase
MEKGIAGEVYNVGTGISYKISAILDKLLSLTKTKIKVEVDEALIRPSDVPELVCNPTKLKALTGWEPEIPLEKTLEDTLDYWRNII